MFLWAGLFVLLCLSLKDGESLIPVLAENSLCLLVLILLYGAIAKWMDIKKYQETWVRHSQHLYLLDREMLVFIQGEEPYHTNEKKNIFFKNVIAVWDANQQKFVKNTEEREKTLMKQYKSPSRAGETSRRQGR